MGLASLQLQKRGTGGASQRDDDSIGFAGSGIGFHSRPDQRKKNASTAAAMMSASSAPPTANLSAPPTASMGEYLWKHKGAVSPVFPQLGLEPNHAGLTVSLLFLSNSLVQTKTQWHSNVLKLFKKSSKLPRTSSRLLQIKRLQLKLTNHLQNSYQIITNNMFLRHGSNNIQNTKNPQKRKSTSKLFHAQTGSIWFQIGSYVVPTWFLLVFDSSDSCSYKLKQSPTCSHAHAMFQDRFKDVQVGSRC